MSDRQLVGVQPWSFSSLPASSCQSSRTLTACPPTKSARRRKVPSFAALSSRHLLLASRVSEVSRCPGALAGQPWTDEEHLRFLQGLNTFGKGKWRQIARSSLHGTKTPTQARAFRAIFGAPYAALPALLFGYHTSLPFPLTPWQPDAGVLSPAGCQPCSEVLLQAKR